MTAPADAAGVLLHRLSRVRYSGGSWTALCPAHEDREPSLHISRGETQPVVLHCHAGCAPDDVLKAAGLTWEDLADPGAVKPAAKPEWTPRGDATAVYDYCDAEGTLLYQVLRTAGKQFTQRAPDPAARSGWRWNLTGVPRVPYRLPKLLAAISAGEMVWVCYSDDTEVLTPAGWLRFPDLPAGATVAQYDNGVISFVTPLARQVFEYTGEMVSIAARWSGLLVTPDHRVLCRWKDTEPVTIRAGEVGVQRWLPVSGMRQVTGTGPSGDQARLLAAWQADGVLPSRGRRAGWNLKKDRKKARLREILTALGVPWREQEFPSAPGWTYFTVARGDVPILDLLPAKRFTWDMLDWPETARTALLTELAYWDGDHTGRRGIRYFTGHQENADIICALAVTTGWGAVARCDERPGRPEQQPQWVVNLVPASWRTLGNAPGREHYDGIVYCLTVPSGYLVTRRAGKVTICGNCEGEKDVHALEAAGVTATCNSGGAGKWLPEFAEYFSGAIVRVVADKDTPGQAHARQVAASLDPVAIAVEIAEAATGKDAADHLAAGHGLNDFLITRQAAGPSVPDLAPDLYEFISQADPSFDWIIPDVLERGDRLILTGFEGLGKSMLTRQLAVAAAAGVHPFTGEPGDPVNVLFIDCENTDRKSRRHFRRLEKIARLQGFPVPEGGLRIISKPAGIDLTRDDDAAWLNERVTAHKPDLLIAGPLYRLHMADANEERVMRRVVAALDTARLITDCALITEHHPGHGDSGTGRSVRPTGSSLLMRWPEFGYGLKPRGEPDDSGRYHDAYLVPWRGPREERSFPRELEWGTREADWPWVPSRPGLRLVTGTETS